MPRTKSGQRKIILGKPFIVPNVAISGGSAGGCLKHLAQQPASEARGSVARMFTLTTGDLHVHEGLCLYPSQHRPSANQVVYLQKLRSSAGQLGEASSLLCLGENDDGLICVDSKHWSKILETTVAAM